MDSDHIPAYDSTTSRWQAVSNRDPAAHCRFLYGVKTTKIYCRPTCTGRIARRANVVYFDTKELAEREGFRPCIKCKPDDVAFIGQREEVVLKTLDLIWINKDEAVMKSRLKELAKDIGLTPSYLARVFKKTMGCTVGEYCRQFDVNNALGPASIARPFSVVDNGHDAGLSQPFPEDLVVPLMSSSGPTSVQPLTEVEDARDPYFDIDDWLCMDTDLDSHRTSGSIEQRDIAVLESLA